MANNSLSAIKEIDVRGETERRKSSYMRITETPMLFFIEMLSNFLLMVKCKLIYYKTSKWRHYMSQIILIGDIQALCTGRFVPATRRSTRANYSAGLFQVTASGGIGLPGDCLLSIRCRTGRRHD